MKYQRHNGETGSTLKARNVVIAAAFPPPLHGLSKISQSIAADLESLARVRRYDLSSGSLVRSAAYHLRRTISVIKAAFGILRNGFRDNPGLYIPADGGSGLLYTLVLTALARLSGQSIFVHHHSFSAIDRESRVMSVLVTVAGGRATHVFLCRKMQRQFRDTYGGDWNGLISSNAIHLAEVADHSSEVPSAIRIGLLSNLTREKGLYLFLEMLRACRVRGIPVRGRLAGPIEDEEDRAAVKAAQSELAEGLTYVGPLYGPDKDRFLSELDVFAFPTIYPNEAQPNAVFEAMSAGAAVILFGRGCLGEDVSPDCGLVVPPSGDFVASACEQMAAWHDDRTLLSTAKAAARRRFSGLHTAADEDYRTLLAVIAGRPAAG
jgi:glycosyltransferase involved in cell wall biosynthesis